MFRLRQSASERAAWVAGLETGESLSELVRGAVDLELERRRAEAEKAQADPLAQLLDRYAA